MEGLDIIVKNGFKAEIYQDQLAESPREWDNLGILFCMHRRYTLSDEGAVNPNKWPKKEIAVILPVYLYDHSGLRMATSPFHCPWDSGQVGWIYATKASLRREFGVKRVLAKHIAQARQILEGEIKTMDQYLSGDVYSYHIYDPDENGVDGCSGFYGYEDVKKAAEDALDEFCYSETMETVETIDQTSNVPSRAAQRFWRMNNAPA